MSDEQGQFIKELEKEIGDHPNKQNIIAEYELHVYELIKELPMDDKNVYDELIKRLGTPVEIAKIWKQETGITPKKTQWLFVLLNLSIFAGGAVLTISYNVFHWDWLERIWSGLTEVSLIMMLIYLLFWGLLGYEIGKEFGHRGYRLLQKTFIISVIPNIVLMYIVVFKLLPYEWFGSLLSVPFIVLCIIFTGILYPVSMIGYRWGKKVSI